MHDTGINRKIRCPYCNEAMDIFVDISAGDQSYVEDCQICCQPMQISFQTTDDELLGLQVESTS